MRDLFPPLLPKEALQPPVLVLAAHPDDEVIACGGMLLWHRLRGDSVTVVHVSDGARGDPDGRFGDIQQLRHQEGREALARLQVEDLRQLSLPDGELPAHIDEITAQLMDVLREVKPATVYSFFFTEAHRDHRAVARAFVEASPELDGDCRILLFGVNQVVCGGTMFDITGLELHKQHALRAFASQLAYNDFCAKILHRDHAATVNVEDPTVQFAELFADVRRDDLAEVLRRADDLYGFLLGERK